MEIRFAFSPKFETKFRNDFPANRMKNGKKVCTKGMLFCAGIFQENVSFKCGTKYECQLLSSIRKNRGLIIIKAFCKPPKKGN